MANSEYGELVNISDLHSAEVTADTITNYVTGSNDYLAPAGEISHEAKTNINKRYYDGKITFVTSTEGETEVKITLSGVPVSLAAEYTGKPYDAAKGIMIDTGDVSNAPYRTLSGKMDLGDGGSRYFQYNKGKFSIGAQSAASKKDDIDPKTVELTYTAIITEHKFTMPDGSLKGIKGLFADTTDSAFVTANSWFSQVQTPDTIGAPTVLALSSSVPAANATGVVASTAVKLTFNNKIDEEAITLVKASDNSVVTVSKSWDATGKILTMTPGASLTSAGVYLVVISGVKDVFGQKLTTSVNKFTVA